MEESISYQYEANNKESYDVLAAYATNLSVNVSLFPMKRTIVIDGNVAEIVGEFIDCQGLDFHIAPIELHAECIGDLINNETTDAATLRRIIYQFLEQQKMQSEQQKEQCEKHINVIEEITRDRDKARESSETYLRWYHDVDGRLNRVKVQVQALAVMIDSIFPKDAAV